MRLNQFISSSGFCSRRRADVLIKEQRVTVNGELIKLGHVIRGLTPYLNILWKTP